MFYFTLYYSSSKYVTNCNSGLQKCTIFLYLCVFQWFESDWAFTAVDIFALNGIKMYVAPKTVLKIMENVLASSGAFPNRWQQSHYVCGFREHDCNMIRLENSHNFSQRTQIHIPVCNNISVLFNIEMISLRSAVLQTVNTSQ